MTKPTKPAPAARLPWEVADDDVHPINLEVQYRTGDGCFFPYAYLVYCHFDRGGVIELHFSSWVLRIEGRSLGGLYAALGRHSVASVSEGENEESASETEPFISRLVVAESDSES